MKLRTLADLQYLIDESVEESTELEFKLNFAMPDDELRLLSNGQNNSIKKKKDWKVELAKDVSGMANANGGTIIYGMNERESESGQKVASELIPISIEKMDKDRLTRLLLSNISPNLEFDITFVPSDNGRKEGFFIVDIPQGTTAYQNKLDHRYYTRHCAVVEAMEDFEVRDVMNRVKNPQIDLEFSITRTKVFPHDIDLPSFNERDKKLMREGGFVYRLNYTLINKGPVYAKFINFLIFIPQNIVKDGSLLLKNGNTVLFGDNKNDKTGYEPLLPHMKDDTKCIHLEIEGETIDDNLFIEYEVHADNSDVKRGKIRLNEIPCVNIEGWKDGDIKLSEDVMEMINRTSRNIYL